MTKQIILIFAICIVFYVFSAIAYPAPDTVFEPEFALREHSGERRRFNLIPDYDFGEGQDLHHSDDGFPTVT
ncbi:hypothetical protein TcasGA2_TC000445 [Tribolium castaneum]|uniref:Uncharacterized protein n=1 Tax=Tribolium castaneum TaxID=7070 RepID=D6WA82_TRICA|nr:PREDICTED: uncharacterized protein LOC100142380 [Tribolium castaneum]EEZ98041.1 hypothetical protein TcasGA2_TC000445 [Tribolium castaneum]|eukprot:XP_001811599.1 PREDICTED: uncharacterized protein LOC100142380 [Tribolium castaneum]